MSTKQFKVGQRVAFEYGSRDIPGVIVEDRGPIGVNGRVLYRIEFRFNDFTPEMSYIELPVMDIKEVEDEVPVE